MELRQHISQQYDKELEDIRNQALKMGGLVERQAENAVKALLERDQELATNVIETDVQVNQMEVDIDDECTRVIARRQPAASDLRLIIAVVKVITDLERIGDEAEKIGSYSKKLAKKKVINDGMHHELAHLSKLVLSMLHDALDAFARMDDEQALKIIGMNEAVNKEVNNLSRLLITHMMEDVRNIKNAIRINWCARSLERIGDHSRNISEYVVFLVKGKDIRHTDLDTIRKKYYLNDEDE